MRNERGQMTMETILIMTVLSTVALMVVKTAKSQEWGANLVEGPWLPVRGMIENGVWNGNLKVAKNFHPALKKRHATAEGAPIPPK